jgi:hypothetical protein
MSEMRRAAKALVERKSETFESRYTLAESKARLEPAIAALRLGGATQFRPHWKSAGDKVLLEAEFLPSRRILRVLKVSSFVLMMLIVVSVWAAVSSEEGALRFLVPLFTVLAILAFPFVALALSSNREAEESRIRRAIRKALLDADDKFPQRQHWDDED